MFKLDFSGLPKYYKIDGVRKNDELSTKCRLVIHAIPKLYDFLSSVGKNTHIV